MPAKPDEIQRRTEAALAAISAAYGTAEDEDGVTLFVSHHLDEIERDFWQKRLGTDQPEPAQVLSLLELQSHWGDQDENGIDTFDFTLPESVTNYMISVRFDGVGNVEDISMES